MDICMAALDTLIYRMLYNSLQRILTLVLAGRDTGYSGLLLDGGRLALSTLSNHRRAYRMYSALPESKAFHNAVGIRKTDTSSEMERALPLSLCIHPDACDSWSS